MSFIYFFHYRKAEMGIGTLIIFIALLLVAAIAAGVLIQTSGSLQEKALTTGDQAKAQIATNIKVVEVSATDGSDSYVDHFNQIIKLAPGSSEIKIGDSVLTMNTYDKTASLQYRGINGTTDNSNTGYNTWNLETVTGDIIINQSISNYTLAEDYDDDGYDDMIRVNHSGYVIFDYSTATDYAVPLTSVDCSGANSTFDVTVDVNSDQISSIYFKGVCGQGTIYGSNMTMDITPHKLGKGYFTVQYLQTGTNHFVGNLQRGDIVKLYFEAPKSISEDEKIRINFIPKIGISTLTEFITPEVMSSERAYLYP